MADIVTVGSNGLFGPSNTLLQIWQMLLDARTGAFPLQVSGGGGGGAGNPGGSNGQVQYNNAGVFGGFTGMTITGGALSAISGGVSVNGVTLQGSGTLITTGGTLGSNAFTSTAYAPLASPALTGVPTAPTATVGTNTTQLATTAFVLANAGPSIPGSATQVLTSNGSGGVTATGVTIDGGNNIMSNGEFTSVSGGFGFNGNYFDVLRYLRIGSDDSILIQKAAPGVLGLPASILTTTDSGTNTIVNALTLTHATSATAASGLGVGQVFQLPSDAGTLRSAGQINSVWDSAVDGSEGGRLDFYCFKAGVQFLGLTIGSSGNVQIAQAIDSGTWQGSRIGTGFGGVAIDTGWTANASGGSKTVAVQNFSASGFTGTMTTALNTVSAGTGTFFAAQAQQVQDLTNKLQALEATLVLSTMPNA